MDVTVVEIIVSVVLSLSTTIAVVAIAWGKIANQVKTNENEIEKVSEHVEKLEDKMTPLNSDNTRNDVLMSELMKALATANQQIEALKDIVNELKVEVELLKEKHK